MPCITLSRGSTLPFDAIVVLATGFDAMTGAIGVEDGHHGAATAQTLET